MYYGPEHRRGARADRHLIHRRQDDPPRDRLSGLVLLDLLVGNHGRGPRSRPIRYGAIDFPPVARCGRRRSPRSTGHTPATLDGRIFTELRLPRAILCLFVGASLGVGGTLMQALFRNPIVEPGLVGTSSGAALGASLYFVLGSMLHLEQSTWSLPLAACVGGVIATWLVFALAQTRARRPRVDRDAAAHRTRRQRTVSERHRLSVRTSRAIRRRGRSSSGISARSPAPTGTRRSSWARRRSRARWRR